MKVTGVTIGADPELFLVNSKTGEVVSSIGIIPGEKGNPYRSKDMPEGYGLEIDNILAEFNIPPVSSKEDFIEAMTYMKNYIKKHDDEDGKIMAEFRELIAQDKKDKIEGAEHLEAASYNDVKKWFLAKCPEIKEYKEQHAENVQKFLAAA